MEKPSKIAPAKGKLGVLLPGMGAVSTTLWPESSSSAKQVAARGIAHADGHHSAGQAYGRAFAAHQGIRPFAGLSDLAFGGWDIFKDNAYQSAANAGVLNPQDLAKVKPFLSSIKTDEGRVWTAIS